MREMSTAAGNAVKGITLGLAATGTLALTWAAPAAAQSGRAPAFAPMGDPFNAFSIGVGGGFDVFRTTAFFSASDYWAGNYGSFEQALRGTGGFGTVEVGKDFRFDRLVLGVYGEYNFGSKS